MPINSGQWTGFPLKRNRSTGGKFLSSSSCLISSCDVKRCVTWVIKVSFPLTRLSINKLAGVLVLVKKLFILMLLLVGIGEDFFKWFW